jgi:hypothetical protein
MRIVQAKPWRDWAPVESLKAGTPIQFEHPFHQKHEADDLFIINAVCHSYRPDDRKYAGKVCVTNLRTGEVAYVDRDRRCCYVKCRVEMGDPEC